MKSFRKAAFFTFVVVAAFAKVAFVTGESLSSSYKDVCENCAEDCPITALNKAKTDFDCRENCAEEDNCAIMDDDCWKALPKDFNMSSFTYVGFKVNGYSQQQHDVPVLYQILPESLEFFLSETQIKKVEKNSVSISKFGCHTILQMMLNEAPSSMLGTPKQVMYETTGTCYLVADGDGANFSDFEADTESHNAGAIALPYCEEDASLTTSETPAETSTESSETLLSSDAAVDGKSEEDTTTDATESSGEKGESSDKEGDTTALTEASSDERGVFTETETLIISAASRMLNLYITMFGIGVVLLQ